MYEAVEKYWVIYTDDVPHIFSFSTESMHIFRSNEETKFFSYLLYDFHIVWSVHPEDTINFISYWMDFHG